ncbi:hypothetical protein [Streptosporangium sp. NPDC006930]|uniref:hypothetical protein n=1 Tax=Streptosporangium sp. NPDC006930 TaxID=3154783 RepID=UPI0034431288
MTPDPHCQACGTPLDRLWSLYVGNYWGARELQYISGRAIDVGKCPAARGVFGLKAHTPPS